MNTRAKAKLAASGGLITRQEALDCGVTPSTIAKLLRDKVWIIVRRSVYADARVWAELDDYTERPRLRSRAAVAVMHRAWVLSHDSAAHELGLAILRPQPQFVHVTRPGFSSAWTRNGVKHHYARFQPGQVVEVDGMRVLDVARTVADIGRERGELHGLVAADAALRLGVSRSALLEACVPMEFWPGITGVRSAIDRARPGAENPAESLGRDLVEELGIGEVETQFPVQVADGRIFRSDLRVGNHLFEVDGQLKYLARERGGVADVRAEQVVWDEKLRERLICAEGLGMSRIFWKDFWGADREQALRRLRADYEVTRQRFGPTLAPAWPSPPRGSAPPTPVATAPEPPAYAGRAGPANRWRRGMLLTVAPTGRAQYRSASRSNGQ